MNAPAITLNGETKTFADGAFPATIAALIAALRLDADTLIAEVDGEIVKSDAFAATPLRAGATVELIQFVGGG